MLKYGNLDLSVRSNITRKKQEGKMLTKRGIADPLYTELVKSKRLHVDSYIEPRFSIDIDIPEALTGNAQTRVFHILNVSNFNDNPRLLAEQDATIDSILNVYDGNYEIVLCGDRHYTGYVPNGLYFLELTLTAVDVIDGATKNLPFIHDMLNGISNMANDNDWLLISNIDCRVPPSIYNELNRMDCDVVEYKRQDMSTDGTTKVVDWGLDGMAIRKRVWDAIKYKFPDFILGACHWDQGLFTFNKQTQLKKCLDVESLLHNKHEPTWDYFNPDIYDQYNIKLLDDMYEELEIPMGFRPEFVKGPLNQPSSYAVRKPVYDDTHIIFAIWGDSILVKNLKNVLNSIKEQTINPKVILVELLSENGRSYFPDGIDGAHIIINGTVKNMGIFQKEALWNIGAKSVPDNEYCIFCDADVWSNDIDWLYKIRVKLDRHRNSVVQAFSTTNDDGDVDMNLYSFIRHNTVYPLGNGTGTGVGYGLSKAYFNSIGGFNPFAVVSNGDTLFMYEIYEGIESTIVNNFYGRKEFKHWGNMIRNVPKCYPDSVGVILNHQHHGSFKSRKYIQKALIIQYFKNAPPEYVTLNKYGTVEWKDIDCIERDMLSSIDAFESVDELLNEYEI